MLAINSMPPPCIGHGIKIVCNVHLCTNTDLLCGCARGVWPPGSQLLHELVHLVEEDLPRARRISIGPNPAAWLLPAIFL